MQEEVNQQAADVAKKMAERSVVLVIRAGVGGAKLTADMIKSAMRAALNATGHGDKGKMPVSTLIRKDQGVQNIEITDQNIKPFERIARKYGVDFAIKKDPAENKYLVFFKGRDADAITAAFAEYTAETVKKQQRPPIRRALEHFREIAKNIAKSLEKRREQGAR